MLGELNEKQIENQCLSWLKARRYFAFKIKSVGTYDPTRKRFRTPSPWYRKGCPDILCCFRGRFIGLEVKTKKGRLSEHQKSFHQDLTLAGGFVYVVRSIDDLVDIFSCLEGVISALPPLQEKTL